MKRFQAPSRFTFLLLVAVCVATLAPGDGSPTAAQEARFAQGAQGYEPVFEPAVCVNNALQRYQNNQAYDVACGYLVVPEDRNVPDGPSVRLPVAIFRTLNPDPAPDPVIYLAGGGGHNHLDSAGFYIDFVGSWILQNRDFIQYNQRGAHYTEPEVACAGYRELMWALAGQGLTPEERNAGEAAFLLECRDTLLAQGINLEMYNSAVNAADARDLRIALGYEEANYYGTSYGTKLALTLMRDYPEGIRSVIIDSVYPLQANYYVTDVPNAYRALQMIFESCAADSSCSNQYPDLEATFFEVVDTLNANPSVRPLEGHRVVVDGNFFMEAIDTLQYSPRGITEIPWHIGNASRGYLDPLDDLFAALLNFADTISWPMWYSMQCHEEAVFEPYADVLAQAEGYPPQFADFWTVRWPALAYDLCAVWGVTPAAPIENQAVASDIPTLVFAGEFDPETPPAWSKMAAETLSNSFYYEFPGLGHGIMRSNSCGLEIGLAFIDDPTTAPDASCIDDLSGPVFR